MFLYSFSCHPLTAPNEGERIKYGRARSPGGQHTAQSLVLTNICQWGVGLTGQTWEANQNTLKTKTPFILCIFMVFWALEIQ